MKINYKELTLNNHQKALYIKTIERNPYIPSNNLLPTKLYNLQIYANTYESKRKLLGGSAFSGKSIYGAASALQFFDWPDYRGLVLRRTYDDVTATGGVVDYIEKWTKPFDYIEHNKQKKAFINNHTDAKIFYNYMMYLKDRKKFKSRAYHKIIVDEASEILRENLQYLNRSLRDAGNPDIPLSIEYISNPDYSSGIEYLNENFVSEKGQFPYFEMNFWNNPFVDPYDYYDTLTQLSRADFQYQMGNWDYVIESGDIFDLDDIIAATLTQNQYEKYLETHPVRRLIRTWDIAASEGKQSKYTACSLFEIFRGGVGILKEQQSFKLLPGRLETKIHEIMGRDMDEGIEQFIEFQPAAAGKIMAYDWKREYKEYRPKFEPVFKNKVVRAGKVVPILKNAGRKNPDPKRHQLFFLENPDYPFMKKLKAQMLNFPNEKLDETVEDQEQFNSDRIDNLSLYVQLMTGPKRTATASSG